MLQRRRLCSNWFSSWKKAKFSANRENCVITLFMPQNSWKLRTWKHVKPLELGKNWGKGSIILKTVGKLRSSRSVIRSSNICCWATSLLSSQQKFLDLMSEALWLEDAMHSWKHLPVNWMSIFIANSESKTSTSLLEFQLPDFYVLSGSIQGSSLENQCSPRRKT